MLSECETCSRPAQTANDTNPPSLFFGTVQPEFMPAPPARTRSSATAATTGCSPARGDDYVDGGRDNDEIHGGAGADIMAGRFGQDIISATPATTASPAIAAATGSSAAAGRDKIFGNIDPDRSTAGPARIASTSCTGAATS